MALTEQAVIAAEGLMLQSTTGQKHPDHRSPGGTVRIHEFACPPGRAREFMPAFHRFALDRGVREIIGHCTDPEITAAVLKQRAEVKDVFSGWAVYCQDLAVQSAILNGQVLWSQLDGESWLSFRGR